MARRTRSRAIARSLDFTDLAEGLARPGNDTREWASMATVRGGTTDDDPCVEWVRGQPLVRVILHPSGTEARARVGMRIAGNGEAEYHPFMPGDEVLVSIPSGNPRAGCVITSKLCNEIDAFPEGSVAGQDPRSNTFAFSRTRTPRVDENAGPVIIRSALNGGFLTIDEAGVLTLRGGNVGDGEAKLPAPGFQMGPDGIAMQDASAKFALQLNVTDGVFIARADDAILTLASSSSTKPSMLGVPGALAIGTAGNPPLEHAASAESVANFLYWELTSFATMISALGGAPLTGVALGAAIVTWLTTGGYAVGAATAGASPLPSDVLAAIVEAFTAATAKPNTAAGQSRPGLGSPGLLIG